MSFQDVIELAGKVVDGLGVAVLVLGTLGVLIVYVVRVLGSSDRDGLYTRTRQQIGRVILLGLELLVAADIVRTVATSPTFRNVGVLAVIVLIRTFLSFALQVELEGRWPWQAKVPELREGDARRAGSQ